MKKRVVVFIDNSNVYKSIFDLHKVNKDWCTRYNPLHLASKLAGSRKLVSILFYCTAPPPYLQKTNINKYTTQNKYYTSVGKLDKVEIKYGTLQLSGDVPAEKGLDTFTLN